MIVEKINNAFNLNPPSLVLSLGHYVWEVAEQAIGFVEDKLGRAAAQAQRRRDGADGVVL